MTKYVVKNEFLDRFDGCRHCQVGEPHEPHNEQRAQVLLQGGFIEVVEEVEKPEKPVRERKTKPEGEADGKKATDE